jgi:hypothetical protein
MFKEQKGRRIVTRGTHRVAALAVGIAATYGIVPLAHADDASNVSTVATTGADWSKMFSFSGFGSVGMTHSSLDTADYTTNIFQSKGAGASSRYNFTDNTKVGAQVNAQFTQQLSAVVQVIMQQQYNNLFAPTIEWANVKYAFTPDFSVRIGRIELPSFLSSDYRNVGYSTPWAHVPLETYNLVGPDTSDGVDASYTMHFGKLSNTVQVVYGYNSFHVPVEGQAAIKFTAKNILGVFDTIEQGALTVHGGYEQAHVQANSLPPGPLTFYNIGLSYDPGSWFVQSEWSHITTPKATPGYESWYVIGGYRIQKFTPYAMYSIQHSLGGVTLVNGTVQNQKDYSVGVRWDFRRSMDLKLQYDRVVLPNNSSGYFTNPQPGFALGSSANVISAVLDFVF